MVPIKPVRTAARAIIIHDGRLLAVKMKDKKGLYYILPGGGQNPGETLAEAVKREVLEETGVAVEVDGLVYVREYIGKNHTFSPHHAAFHQVEHVFLCRITNPHAVKNGATIDNHQVGVAWLALDNLESIRFYPESIKQYFSPQSFQVPCFYLGDCN